MKKKILIITSAIVTVSTSIVCALTLRKNTSRISGEAAAKTRTLTIDMTKYSTNASGSTSVSTTSGNKIWIYYGMNRKSVYNTTAITNLTSVQIYYTTSSLEPGSAYVVFGSSKNPTGVETMRSSGTTVNNTNSSYKYFTVGQATYESISLTKVIVKYNC